LAAGQKRLDRMRGDIHRLNNGAGEKTRAQQPMLKTILELKTVNK